MSEVRAERVACFVVMSNGKVLMEKSHGVYEEVREMTISTGPRGEVIMKTVKITGQTSAAPSQTSIGFMKENVEVDTLVIQTTPTMTEFNLPEELKTTKTVKLDEESLKSDDAGITLVPAGTV